MLQNEGNVYLLREYRRLKDGALWINVLFGWFVGWLIGWLFFWLADWLISWVVGWLIVCLFWLVCLLVG
jgi:hypothetical protein